MKIDVLYVKICKFCITNHLCYTRSSVVVELCSLICGISTYSYCQWDLFPLLRTMRKYHRAGLNRGVPIGQSTQIMGGSFRRGLNSEVVTFSNRLAVQPSPLYKINGKKNKMAASYFCMLPSDWPKQFYPSIQVQLYGNYHHLQ